MMAIIIIKMVEHEATVDICLHLSTIRNLSEEYLSKSYFRISVTAEGNAASPYQIIPHSKVSTISITHYLSPVFTLVPRNTIFLKQLAVFKAILPLANLEQSKLQICVQLCEQKNDQAVDQVCLEFSGAAGINSYLPICFGKSKCAIDATITSQLLSCRFRNILNAPKALLLSAAQGLLIAFNRLRQRLKKDAECQYEVQSFPEMEEVHRFTRARIFHETEQEQRAKLLEFQRKLPKVSFCVQQLWAKYLSHELDVDIKRQRRTFLKTYDMQIKHKIERSSPNNEDCIIIDGLKLPGCLLSLKAIEKNQIQMIHQEQSMMSQEEQLHLVFLVHGFGASSKTLQQMQLALRFFFPHIHVITSKVNENRTDDDLLEMGRRLALEIQATLQALQAKDNFSLSFIGHSMGGLIIRVALPLLQHHKFSLKLYISLGTPHLGYLFHNSTITKAGMWAYHLFNKSPSMSALLMRSQSNDPRHTLLYDLSRSNGLQWFQQVLLYAGMDDYYVSEQSALMLNNELIQQQLKKNTERAIVWEQMRSSLNESLKKVALGKYLVNFDRQNQMKEGSMSDELLGRKNHINLVTSASFVIALVVGLSSAL